MGTSTFAPIPAGSVPVTVVRKRTLVPVDVRTTVPAGISREAVCRLMNTTEPVARWSGASRRPVVGREPLPSIWISTHRAGISRRLASG